MVGSTPTRFRHQRRCIWLPQVQGVLSLYSEEVSEGIIPVVMQQTSELLKKALALPVDERAELAGSFLESLDTQADKAAEAGWNLEIARRIEELDSGRAKRVPWEEIRRWISARLSHGSKAR